MPRGGERPGSGPKPKGRNLLAFSGRGAAQSAAVDPSIAVLAEPPADLSDVPPAGELTTVTAKSVWRLFAPLAIELGTLTPHTVPGFRELAQQYVMKEDAAARLMKYGMGDKSGRERARSFAQLAQRLDASLARFKLTAFGKPAEGAGAKKPSAANPWAAEG